MRLRWDIFCTVIDNYGDIGVCWRLARQLTHEFHQIVRLWVDDLHSFAVMMPEVNPSSISQRIQGVDVRLWQQPFAVVEPAEVVIEAFACELPEIYVAAMVQQERQPVWINLEYLSAEPWVTNYHCLPSPQPRTSLIKTFFFPGFVPGSGGLLREKNLMICRNGFTAEQEQDFLQRIGLPPRKSGETRISLFCYDSAPIEQIIAIWAQSTQPVVLLVPQGRAVERIVTACNAASTSTGQSIRHNHLTIYPVPFLEQSDYDQLLWSCDFNFVRGEDSFVRAQWAANPFVWNIYPQSDHAHRKKLDAFLAVYSEGMPKQTADALLALWLSWNNEIRLTEAIWLDFYHQNSMLRHHNHNWVSRLSQQSDLAQNLMQHVLAQHST